MLHSNEYILANRLLVGIFIFTCLFVGLFLDEGSIQCIHKSLTTESCSSCGLTRDFISFLKFNFKNPVNQASLGLFFFVVVQLIFRIGIVGRSYLYKVDFSSKFQMVDLAITSIAIMIVFRPFW